MAAIFALTLGSSGRRPIFQPYGSVACGCELMEDCTLRFMERGSILVCCFSRARSDKFSQNVSS